MEHKTKVFGMFALMTLFAVLGFTPVGNAILQAFVALFQPITMNVTPAMTHAWTEPSAYIQPDGSLAFGNVGGGSLLTIAANITNNANRNLNKYQNITCSNTANDLTGAEFELFRINYNGGAWTTLSCAGISGGKIECDTGMHNYFANTTDTVNYELSLNPYYVGDLTCIAEVQ